MSVIAKYGLSALVFLSGASTGYKFYDTIDILIHRLEDSANLRSDMQIIQDAADDNPRVENAVTLVRLVYEK